MSDCSIPETYDETFVDSSTDAEFDSMVSMTVDVDQDGYGETTVIDFEGDGVADAIDVIDANTGMEALTIDTDADGLMDTAVVDVEGDGVFDVGASDTDGDGVADETFDPATGEIIDDPFALDDPGNDPNDGVHGDPMTDIPYHQAQASSNDCLPTSVAMVLSEITGTDVPAGDVADLANELGLLGETGMSMEGGLTLLEHYGVDAEVQTGTMDELRTMLDSDVPVIIGLDSDDLYGTGDSPFADDLVAGHAVVITGIDDEAGLVYINDPGFPDGAGVAIPIEEFEDAWKDADNSMIVANADATASGESVNDDGSDDDGLVRSIVRLALLPVNLVLR